MGICVKFYSVSQRVPSLLEADDYTVYIYPIEKKILKI